MAAKTFRPGNYQLSDGSRVRVAGTSRGKVEFFYRISLSRVEMPVAQFAALAPKRLQGHAFAELG